MHPIQNGTPNGDMQRVPAMQEPLNDICRGWRRRVVRREILHMSLSQREVPAAAGWMAGSHVVTLCVPGASLSLVYFDALFGLLALLAPTGGRRAGREDWDLLVAVVVSADLTPA